MSQPCNCDGTIFPKPLAIAAALSEAHFRSARSLGGFSAWRESLLTAMSQKPALDHWRARDPFDLGLMLVEMAAYVGDIVSFYDALVANDAYLQTAVLPGAKRKLVGLIGYRPRPAVASEVLLAAEADGLKTITLTQGTAFRSSAFLDVNLKQQPPQVFEITEPKVIEPRINKVEVARVSATRLPSTVDRLYARPGSVRVRSGDAVVVNFNGVLAATRVFSVNTLSLRGAVKQMEIRFADTLTPPSGALYSSTRLLAPGFPVGLWKGGQSDVISGSNVILEGQHAVQAGEIVLLENSSSLAARKVNSVGLSTRLLFHLADIVLKDKGGTTTGTLTSPDINLNVTRVTLDSALSWSYTDADKVVFYHRLTDAAHLISPLSDVLAQGDPIILPGLTETPRVCPSQMLLEDAHANAQGITGSLDATNRQVSADATPVWDQSLAAPVNWFGNVITATRGETVKAEILGVGDASAVQQRFKLKKKPLTYLNVPNSENAVSTLIIHVAGIAWQEIPNFYGKTDADRVFVVEQDDDGESWVIFGGGSRVPTGSLIQADYRFGAGAAQPPAGSIIQLAKPVVGLKRIHNPSNAFGGADAESSAALAAHAPTSALLLGRAVSLVDLAAGAATVPGVKAVKTSWRWDSGGLRPVALISYIGDSQLVSTLYGKLRDLVEDDTPLQVLRVQPQSARLAIQLLIDDSYLKSMVISQVRDALFRAPDDTNAAGLLRPETLGPEGTLFLSPIVEAVMAISGVTGIQSISFNQSPFNDPGVAPPAGTYWSFGDPTQANFGILINGTGGYA